METKNTELEEMRQQLGILKSKLDNQTLVNDKLIRQSMLNKMSFMKKYTWVSFLALLFIYYVYNDIRITFNLSWWFYGATVIFMTFTVCFDAYINRFNKEAFLNGDLIATSLQMQRMKKLRKRSLLYGIFFMTIWVSWFVIELLQWFRCCEWRRKYIHVLWYAGWWWRWLNRRSSHRYMVIPSYATH